MTTMAASPGMAMSNYPVDVEVDPPAPQSRISVFFRILMVIPHLIVLAFLGIATAVVGFIAWLAILFTGKYPQGLLNFALGVFHWSTRVNGYAYLLTGTYPAFATGADDSYPVRVHIVPQLEGRNRVTVFFRFLMIIPHVIVLYFVNMLASLFLLFGWFAALFTGSMPLTFHNFLVGFLRWNTRVNAYASYFIDDYPPFSMS